MTTSAEVIGMMKNIVNERGGRSTLFNLEDDVSIFFGQQGTIFVEISGCNMIGAKLLPWEDRLIHVMQDVEEQEIEVGTVFKNHFENIIGFKESDTDIYDAEVVE